MGSCSTFFCVRGMVVCFTITRWARFWMLDGVSPKPWNAISRFLLITVYEAECFLQNSQPQSFFKPWFSNDPIIQCVFSRYARSRPSASLNIDKIFSKRSQMFVIEQKDELLRLIRIDLLITQSKHLHPQPNALTTTCATRSSQNKLKTSNLERIHHFTRCSTRVLSALEPISCLIPKFRRALQIRNIRYDFCFPGFSSLCRLRNVKQLLHGLVALRQYTRKSLQIVANSSDSQ
ncbi:unnamed protein product [Albugo candida]|uniref:Uncharacterized protein n=1 Tax=Albugo candida TaxID=65357 RepID=A0A024G5E1_9STRA|nr:unnamed protein product [Albugo candida]|eukprot:CCI41778.1 unnamed protein product [Albugo candida]